MLSSIFVGHGAPSLIFEDNEYVEAIKNYSSTIQKPDAIVIFSAHFEEEIQTISVVEKYDTIYDFYGFEEELYKIKYPAKGDPKLAKQIALLLNSYDIETRFDNKRGLDHGAWSVLKLMYPNCDIPVVSMSINAYLTPQAQYNIGKALIPLKDKNILLIMSGGIVHNLGKVQMGSGNDVDEWATKFDNWIIDKIEKWDTKSLFDYMKLAPNASIAVPRDEHFLLLLIAMGSGALKKNPKLLKSCIQYKNLSLDLYSFE